MYLGQKFGQRKRSKSPRTQQGRQDSNLQPPVLETGALPIELRPWAARTSVASRRAASLLSLLFALIAVALGGLALFAVLSGGRAIVVGAAAAGLALWMGDLARKAWP